MRPKLRALISDLAALPGCSVELAITSVLVELRNIVSEQEGVTFAVLELAARAEWEHERRQKIAAKLRARMRRGVDGGPVVLQ